MQTIGLAIMLSVVGGGLAVTTANANIVTEYDVAMINSLAAKSTQLSDDILRSRRKVVGIADDCMLRLALDVGNVSDHLQAEQMLVAIASSVQSNLDDNLAADYTKTYTDHIISNLRTTRESITQTLGISSCAASPIVMIEAQQLLSLVSQTDAALRPLSRRIETSLRRR